MDSGERFLILCVVRISRLELVRVQNLLLIVEMVQKGATDLLWVLYVGIFLRVHPEILPYFHGMFPLSVFACPGVRFHQSSIQFNSTFIHSLC